MSSDTNAIRILVVDDHPVVREGIEYANADAQTPAEVRVLR